MRPAIRIVVVLAAVLSVPALTFAQGSITGVVRDSSGVLPGATVEVSSPVLIEKLRTASTDGSGQYRIIDLRPGTYTVTVKLQGFNSVRREGIEVTGTAVSRVDAEMRIGSLEETLTVTAESPIVDVQSVRRQTTVDGDVIASLPTSRSYGALFQLIPAVAGGSRDVLTTPGLVVFGGAGGRGTEGRLQVDGLGVGAPLSGGGVSSYIPDVANTQEVTFTTSGGLGEAEVGGPIMNIVPKTGGNTLRGNVYIAGVSRGMVGSNYTDELEAAGLRAPGELLKLWDFTAGVGGPILRDRIWYFVNVRDEGSWQSVPGMYANQNAGDPTKFIYVPDLTRQAATAGSWRIANARLTVQPTPRNRFNLFWDEQNPCQGSSWAGTESGCRQQPSDEWIVSGAPGSAGSFGVASATAAPEISNYGGRRHAYQRVTQGTWTSPLTSRLLLDGGFGTQYSHYGGQEMPGNPTRPIPRMVEQCFGTAPVNAVPNACAHGISNLTFGSQDWSSNQGFVLSWRASASYVTGAHSMKLGYQGGYHRINQSYFSNDHHLTYRLNYGVPNLLTLDLKPFKTGQRTRMESVYAQEQWTHRRLTLQGALRYDHAWSYFPDQQVGPVTFLPAGFTLPAQKGVLGYDDITARGGAAYDVFGNGNTSLKVNVGKYLEAATNHNVYSLSNPAARIAGSPVLGAPPPVTRPWTDANSNYVPDCDLLNPNMNDYRPTGGDLCGVLSNTNFGQPIFSGSFDPDILEGWGVRPSDGQVGVSVQQKLLTACVGGSWLLQALAPGFHRDRQPGGERSRLRPVLYRCAVGCPVAWRWRLQRQRSLQRQSGQGRTDGEPLDHREQVRRADVGVQRSADQCQCPHAERPDRAGWGQRGEDRHRQLRDSGGAARDRADRPLLPQRPGVHHAGHRPGLVYSPEGRRAGERYVPERPGDVARGELRGYQRRGTTDAGSTVVGRRRADDHREPDRAGHAVWRPREHDRSARCEDPSLRFPAHEPWSGPLQHLQFQRGADVQPGVQSRRHLACSDVGDAGAIREGKRLDRFLARLRLRPTSMDGVGAPPR